MRVYPSFAALKSSNTSTYSPIQPRFSPLYLLAFKVNLFWIARWLSSDSPKAVCCRIFIASSQKVHHSSARPLSRKLLIFLQNKKPVCHYLLPQKQSRAQESAKQFQLALHRAYLLGTCLSVQERTLSLIAAFNSLKAVV